MGSAALLPLVALESRSPVCTIAHLVPGSAPVTFHCALGARGSGAESLFKNSFLFWRLACLGFHRSTAAGGRWRRRREPRQGTEEDQTALSSSPRPSPGPVQAGAWRQTPRCAPPGTAAFGPMRHPDKQGESPHRSPLLAAPHSSCMPHSSPGSETFISLLSLTFTRGRVEGLSLCLQAFKGQCIGPYWGGEGDSTQETNPGLLTHRGSEDPSPAREWAQQ